MYGVVEEVVRNFFDSSMLMLICLFLNLKLTVTPTGGSLIVASMIAQRQLLLLWLL